MNSGLERVKGFLARFFPVTIRRFNQEMREVQENLLENQNSLHTGQDVMSSQIHDLAVQITDVYEHQAEFLRILEKQDSLRIGQDALSASVHGLAEQIAVLQEQLREVELSVQKPKGIERIIHRRSDRVEMALVHCIPRAELSFEVALAEHCDLNCAGCDHFSSIAEPEFADYEETKRDFARLSELFDGRVCELHLLGGEPLLHPDLIKFLKMAREFFPTAIIDVTTNGLKLLNQPEEFWRTCHDNNIVIRPTKYPISLDFEEIERRAAEYNVCYRYFGHTGDAARTTNHYRLDIEGRQDGNRSFLLCHRANFCVYLQHGRLYTCTIAPTIRHFNKYFSQNLMEQPDDSIDIYKANSAKEIMEFLARPIPFCRYCMPDKTERGLPWHQSERDIAEWT